MCAWLCRLWIYIVAWSFSHDARRDFLDERLSYLHDSIAERVSAVRLLHATFGLKGVVADLSLALRTRITGVSSRLCQSLPSREATIAFASGGLVLLIARVGTARYSLAVCCTGTVLLAVALIDGAPNSRLQAGSRTAFGFGLLGLLISVALSNTPAIGPAIGLLLVLQAGSVALRMRRVRPLYLRTMTAYLACVVLLAATLSLNVVALAGVDLIAISAWFCALIAVIETMAMGLDRYLPSAF